MFIRSDHAVDLRVPCVGDDEDFFVFLSAHDYSFRLFSVITLSSWEDKIDMFWAFMINKYFFFAVRSFALGVCLVILCAGFQDVWAQRCDVDYEAVHTFGEPNFRSLSFWHGADGVSDFDEGLNTAVLTPAGDGIFVVGHRSAAGSETSVSRKTLMVGKVDFRGRFQWQNHVPLDGFDSVQDVLAYDDGYIVLALFKAGADRMESRVIYLADNGSLVSSKSLSLGDGSKKHNVLSHDITLSKDEKGILYVGTLGTQDGKAHAVFAAYDLKGRRSVYRSFKPGANTHLSQIYRDQNDSLIGVGYIHDAHSRKAGWIIKLDDAGRIIWQQQFSRGGAARLLSVSDFGKDYLAVSGQVVSGGEGNQSAAWLMRVNSETGLLQWQRFYSAAGVHSSGINVLSLGQESLASVLVTHKPVNPTLLYQDWFMRFLTVNSRGVLFRTEEHSYGKGVHVGGVIDGPQRRRFIVGSALRLYDPKDKPSLDGDVREEDMIRSLDSWVLALPGPDLYEDPCQHSSRSKKSSSPSPPAGVAFP